jgi:hypothetical protein
MTRGFLIRKWYQPTPLFMLPAFSSEKRPNTQVVHINIYDHECEIQGDRLVYLTRSILQHRTN